ncbi:protein TPX2-like isoform X2 [Silene latifolia]|uniref:protein TPX2-like isoform X2 n=1 Tax=Silene latifolia TaxID=37657 RepID=UPI003D76FBDD
MEEQDMEMVLEDDIPLYDVVEVDFEYEFDAARFFDFSKPESQAEARMSELWFNSAPNYPPSPFVTKLFQMEGFYSQKADALPLANYDDGMSSVDDDADIHQQEQYSYQNKPYQETSSQAWWNAKGGSLQDAKKQAECLFGGQSTGLTFYNHLANDMKKTKTKSLAKPHMPRSSTLMKPTASQLAKQKQRQQAIDVRFKIGEGLSTSHCGTENQAPKRQKLDGGLSRKIVDMKQPTNLTHKIPKKDIAPQGMNLQSKLRITIPREPDLETAHRAERTRSISSKEGEKPTSTIGRYKARPLNKKILEAPACTIPKRSTPQVQDIQAFRFRTIERAKQTASTATICQTTKGLNKGNPASTSETVNNDGKRCDSVDAPKLAERPLAHSFKARPLDKKILTSRGDLGIFRNSKRDVTVPKEFEFQTAKRNHQNPPIELFSKLSLAGEPQPKNGAKPQLPQRTCIFSKGSKENRWESCHEGQNVKRDMQDTHQGKQILDVTSSGAAEFGPGHAMNRIGRPRCIDACR